MRWLNERDTVRLMAALLRGYLADDMYTPRHEDADDHVWCTHCRAWVGNRDEGEHQEDCPVRRAWAEYNDLSERWDESITLDALNEWFPPEGDA